MRSRIEVPTVGLKYLDERVITAIRAECTRVEAELGRQVCGRYLGDRGGRRNVFWKSRAHTGTHL
jgi:hypothetical protein